jgi:hypothetical protein
MTPKIKGNYIWPTGKWFACQKHKVDWASLTSGMSIFVSLLPGCRGITMGKRFGGISLTQNMILKIQTFFVVETQMPLDSFKVSCGL